MPKRRTQHLKDHRRQISQGNFPKWFAEQVNCLHIVDTFNPACNADIMARRAGYVLTIDELIIAGSDSGQYFRPMALALKTSLYLIPGAYPCGGAAAG